MRAAGTEIYTGIPDQIFCPSKLVTVNNNNDLPVHVPVGEG